MNKKTLAKTYPLWLSMPGFIIYTLFFIIPIIISFIFSFTNWNMSKMNSPSFTGITNFTSLLQDEIFLKSLMNTFIFATFTTVFKTALGLLLALLVVKKFWGNSFFRTLFYMPCVLSTMIVGLLFTAILKQDGLLNNMLNETASAAAFLVSICFVFFLSLLSL